MKSIITFFSELWVKKEVPIQLYKKEDTKEDVVEDAKEDVVEDAKEDVVEDAKEVEEVDVIKTDCTCRCISCCCDDRLEEAKTNCSCSCGYCCCRDVVREEEKVKEDKYILKLKNPNNYTSFNKNDNSDDDTEKYNLKKKNNLDEILEQIILDTVVTECYFTSED